MIGLLDVSDQVEPLNCISSDAVVPLAVVKYTWSPTAAAPVKL